MPPSSPWLSLLRRSNLMVGARMRPRPAKSCGSKDISESIIKDLSESITAPRCVESGRPHKRCAVIASDSSDLAMH